MDLKHGPCKDKNIIGKTYHGKGWTGTEHGKGEPMLDNISELIDQGLDLAYYQVICLEGNSGCMSVEGATSALVNKSYFTSLEAKYGKQGYNCHMDSGHELKDCRARGFTNKLYGMKAFGVEITAYMNY